MDRNIDRCVNNRVRLVVALCAFCISAWSQTKNACDLNGDNVVDSSDVALALNMALGSTPCGANIEAPLTCTVISVQRVINASQGQACITYNTHSVTLNWAASTSSGVAGYNIYRSSTSAGPYTLSGSASSPIVTYTDFSVTAGQTYFYVVTAIDDSGVESAYSNEVQATVPSP